MTTNRVPLLKTEDTLIVPLHGELDDSEAGVLESRLLNQISTTDVRSVVLDISSLETLDLFMARKLVQLVRMIELMDVRTVLVGMRPEVAMTLAECEFAFVDVRTALNLELGLKLLGNGATK